MESSCWRQLFALLHIMLWCLSSCSPHAEFFPVLSTDCEKSDAVRESALHSSLCRLFWSKQQTNQNMFKRFLFHYSKSQNSLGSMQGDSNSVHPLMRLSPNLSARRKKQLLLAKSLGSLRVQG
ncbi:neuromedin-U isoform X2 [Alosa sapidissima]|uniref:neuromedin-U isoform X2 n=1 Tax=Alosa sapidissima TaxID=34773 RepID=UPI001C099D0C|nr:neuromedin-U isoform X2 [Alosa sapidissima]